MALVETTTYRVETVYTVVDKASRGLDDIDKHAKSAHGSAESLSGVLKGLGAAVIGSAGIGAAKHAFIDFNREVQDAKISLSAMLQGNYSTTWEQATKGASDLYSEFQRFSQLTPVTTQEMLEFGRGIAVATAQAGGSIKDITQITEQGVVAAKALGAGGAYASLEITEMLQGNVSKRMRFVQQLLGMAHTNEEEFKKLDAKHRLSLIENVLNSDAMKNATDSFSTSFSGVLSTLEDKIHISLGRAGMPLFEKVTAELSRWSEWLDKNSVKVDHMVEAVGQGLARGFEVVKDVTMWVVDHADVLISIGKVWAASALAGKIGDGLGGTLGGVGKALAGEKIDMGLGGIVQLGVAAYMAGDQIGKLSGIHQSLLEAIDPQRAQYEKLKVSMQAWDDALEQSRRDLQGKGQTGSHATNSYANAVGSVNAINQEINQLSDARRAKIEEYARDIMSSPRNRLTTSWEQARAQAAQSYDATTGYPGQLAKLQRERDTTKERADQASVATDNLISYAMQQLTETQKAGINTEKATQDVMREMMISLKQTGLLLSPQRVLELLLGGDNAATKDPFAQGKPNVTNIKIDRVEVAAKDPDRWIADLDAAAKSRVNAPRSPRAAIRGR